MQADTHEQQPDIESRIVLPSGVTHLAGTALSSFLSFSRCWLLLQPYLSGLYLPLTLSSMLTACEMLPAVGPAAAAAADADAEAVGVEADATIVRPPPPLVGDDAEENDDIQRSQRKERGQGRQARPGGADEQGSDRSVGTVRLKSTASHSKTRKSVELVTFSDSHSSTRSYTHRNRRKRSQQWLSVSVFQRQGR